MTTEELKKYYSDLLIIQYAGKDKAVATIQATVDQIIMDQLPLQVQDAYDLTTAVGIQLDVLGKYVGVVRTGYGIDNQPITLDDADFLQLIKLVLIKNNAGSSLATIQSLLAMNFPGQILVSDNQDMSLNYVLIETLGTAELLQLIVTGGYLPAPMGVGVSATIIPDHTNPFFGFRTYAAPDPTVAGFNFYAFYQLTYPWLSYQL